MHYTEYDTRLAAYAVITDAQGRVLLALWNEGSRRQWTMPGGGVEIEESVEQAVVREVREETGYDVRLGALLGVDTYVLPPHRRLNDSGRSLKAVRTIFRAEVTGGELTAEQDGSTDEARWFTLDEVRALERVSVVDISLRLAGLL
ncbi:hypothetical protein I601_0949 [Nocardioides dokdonensis FR1436]|uniref:Nudix hydrolase domain-containing protein n=1 Tax=Nocardioides dokdonensis FR1436 TaxID=1300347 RepID=A0A1A9GIA6_9ACTN|nr:NUDIX domain-containing protein [Nocardioides dokdonensis]ANH37392.1 hypothetical protein I601_0949 [Nocardioides dokdonensis FR1436]